MRRGSDSPHSLVCFMQLQNIRKDLSGINYRDRLHKDFFQFAKYQGRPLEEHGAVKHIVNSIVGRRKYILNGQFGKAMQKHVMEEIKEASRKEGNEMPLHVKNLTRKVLAHFGEHDKPAPKEEKKVVNHVGRTAPGCVPGAPVQNRVTSISDISRGDSNSLL